MTPDLDETFIVLRVPTTPRTTYSTSEPDVSHVEMRVSLTQLRDWLSAPWCRCTPDCEMPCGQLRGLTDGPCGSCGCRGTL